ncbi:MAG TPA: hypothetical protein VHY84_24795 [Bryobacteraceae bacterium]|jgi:hypothetical protein|nr:hypothetical protein [Bryobacteraceae bacterium]
MADKRWGPESFVPWVEGVALHIGDPVARLRFLKVATPCVPSSAVAPSRPRAAKLLVELAVVVALILGFTMTFVWFVKAPGKSAAGAGIHAGKSKRAKTRSLTDSGQ